MTAYFQRSAHATRCFSLLALLALILQLGAIQTGNAHAIARLSLTLAGIAEGSAAPLLICTPAGMVSLAPDGETFPGDASPSLNCPHCAAANAPPPLAVFVTAVLLPRPQPFLLHHGEIWGHGLGLTTVPPHSRAPPFLS